MEITGRVTADAIVTKTNSGKKVVNFSIAINDSYKAKGASEFIETLCERLLCQACKAGGQQHYCE